MRKKNRIVVVGGGYTGAATAIHLARQGTSPMDIAVIEPRDEVGRGVAYSATDPDHRINAPAGIHLLYPDDPDGLENWLRRTGRFDRDPGIEAFDGSVFPRRAEMGAYVHAEFCAHAERNPSGSDLRHVRDRAGRIERVGDGYRVHLESGAHASADLIAVTTSNEQPNIPSPFAAAVGSHPGFIADPWDLARLGAVAPGARVLVLGAGLTAADVIATLLRDSDPSSIDALSRTGIRPTSRPRSHAGLPQPIWERMNQEPSLFEQKHGPPLSVRAVFSELRADIAIKAREGLPWQSAFDDVRDSLRQLWMKLPLEEKRRFQRHLRRRYDSCRFRYPPQTEEILNAAESAAKLVFHTGHVDHVVAHGPEIAVTWTDRESAKPETRRCDHIVNCVGPPSRPDRSGNPLLHAILEDGYARVAPLGIGLDVDADCRAAAPDGTPQPSLYVLGPLTFAQFGYPLGVPFILDQIVRAVPGMLAALPAAGAYRAHATADKLL